MNKAVQNKALQAAKEQPMGAMELWTQPDVLAMLDRQGWVEWTSNRLRGRLKRGAERWEIEDPEEVYFGWNVPDHVALALLRDDSRQRLEKAAKAKGASLRITVDSDGACSIEEHRWLTEPDAVFGSDEVVIIAQEEAGYDAALVAARKAKP